MNPLDRVCYPAHRVKTNADVLESAGREFARRLNAAVVQLRSCARKEDHKLDVPGGAAVWTSDLGGRKGGRLVYLRRDGRLVVWGFSEDHAVQRDAARWFTADRAEVLFEDLADVTADFLTEEEKAEARRKSQVFAGNLTDDLLRELGLSPGQIHSVRQADSLSLFDLGNIPPATRYKIHELSRLPVEALFAARDDAHLLDFLRGDTGRLLVHLCPEQMEIADRDFDKPMLIRGETGTGKTTILIYKACFHAARHPADRVALFTYNRALANLIGESVADLDRDAHERLVVTGLYDYLREALERSGTPVRLLEEERGLRWDKAVREFASAADLAALDLPDGSPAPWFLKLEFDESILDTGAASLEEYAAVAARPHAVPMTPERLALVWDLYVRFRAWLARCGLDTWRTLAPRFLARTVAPDFRPPFDAVFVDEVQDLPPVALECVRRLAAPPGPRVTLAGDYKQSIYRKATRWEEIGLPLPPGAIFTLRRNFRNSRPILEAAHGLLARFVPGAEPPIPSDRPGPEVRFHYYRGDERTPLLESLARHFHDGEGATWSDIAVFTPFKPESIRDRLEACGIPADLLREAREPRDAVKVTTLHAAKGLEFRVVVITGMQGQLLTDMKPGRTLTLRQAAKLVYVGMTRACNFLAFALHAGKPSNPILEALADVTGRTAELRGQGIEPPGV